MPGLQGPPGDYGPVGREGPVGRNGRKGEPGYSGTEGPKGLRVYCSAVIITIAIFIANLLGKIECCNMSHTLVYVIIVVFVCHLWKLIVLCF